MANSRFHLDNCMMHLPSCIGSGTSRYRPREAHLRVTPKLGGFRAKICDF
jgi:hypothetical protein